MVREQIHFNPIKLIGVVDFNNLFSSWLTKKDILTFPAAGILPQVSLLAKSSQ